MLCRSSRVTTPTLMSILALLLAACSDGGGGAGAGSDGTGGSPALAFRSMDGRGNNEASDRMGSVDTRLLRLAPADYADGVSALAAPGQRSARDISQRVCDQDRSIENDLGTSDYLWQWGQFVDHDIDLTNAAQPQETADVPVPRGDPWFDPAGLGGMLIPFDRSAWDPASGTDPGNPREQINQITAWIDASNVYGSDAERAAALRTLDGTGRLKTSAGDLLPFNQDGLPNAGGDSPDLFLAGDVRANEQVGLTALHTLFVREHNRLVADLADDHPEWDGDRLYQEARMHVGAEMQVITYEEFLPALLGPGALDRYRGYDPDVDASISSEFSTAAYRFGHSALSPTLLRLDDRNREIDAGNLPLADAFFAPERIIDEGGIEPLLRGLAAQTHQRVDVLIVDGVRNFLFGPPGGGGFDLASLNIQRGRDHGLPGYNDVREALGLPRAESFRDVSSDSEVRDRLRRAYDHPDEMDPWVGGLAEDPVRGAHVGPLFYAIIVDQFEALRDGDRFWYRRVLDEQQIRKVERTRLSDVIRANTRIRNEIPDDVFRVASSGRR